MQATSIHLSALSELEDADSVTTNLQPLHLSLGNVQPLSFQPGTLYQYHYSLDVQVDHASTPSPGGTWLRAEALVHMHRLWRDQGGEELLQVQVCEVVKPWQLATPLGSSEESFLPSQAT